MKTAKEIAFKCVWCGRQILVRPPKSGIMQSPRCVCSPDSSGNWKRIPNPLKSPTGGNMKERQIIFSTEMVRAILDGRKTVTRRVVKPQPQDQHWENDPLGRYKHHLNLVECQRGQFLSIWHYLGDYIDSREESNQKILCPYGVPGDRLYVRETWFEDLDPSVGYSEYHYRADWDEEHSPRVPWKPSIHMPKDAARIWLEITDIRVERVQDISGEDAVAEGIKSTPDYAIDYFASLWDSIYEKRGYGWDKNPFVWCISFEVISTNGNPEEI